MNRGNLRKLEFTQVEYGKKGAVTTEPEQAYFHGYTFIDDAMGVVMELEGGELVVKLLSDVKVRFLS